MEDDRVSAALEGVGWRLPRETRRMTKDADSLVTYHASQEQPTIGALAPDPALDDDSAAARGNRGAAT